MDPTRRFARFHRAGFTLIELMVGMAIGLLATIIIMQVMSLFEAQRRTTTGSADAQTNGGIALYSIAREVQMAGFSLFPVIDSALECATATTTYGATGITGGLNPITITEGVAVAGVSASDSITIRYGDSLMGGAIGQISAMSGNAASLVSNLGCKVGDTTLVSTGTTCAMSSVTAVAAGNSPPPPLPSVTLQDATGAVAKANLACLGTWNQVTYAVDPATGNLNRTSVVTFGGVTTTNTTPSVVGVVNLQVQYGIAASANSNQVTRWVNAKNVADLGAAAVDGVSTGVDWGAGLTVANRNRIKAIRVAVVARNAKIEPDVVTAACSSTTAAAPTGLCAWAGSVASPAPILDLSQGDANWARYRYRVFETIIPLRNVIWAKDTL
jgi:type IV pilus assembly protein PilW